MPADIAARYGVGEYEIPDADDGEEEGSTTTTSDEEEADSGLVALEDLEGNTSDVSIAAPIMGTTGGPDWGAVEQRGRLDDGGSGIKYEARYCAPDLEAGESYILRDVDIEQEGEIVTVVITPGTTVEHIDVDGEQDNLDMDDEDDDPNGGTGDDSEEEEDSDTSEEEGSDTTSSSDEEPGEDIIDRVEEEVRRRARNTASGQISRAAVSGRLCGPVSPDTVERAIDELVARGVVEATGGDALHVPGEGIEAGGDGE